MIFKKQSAYFTFIKNGQSLYHDDAERTRLAQNGYMGRNTFCYYKDGLYHREDGPACLEWRNDENIPWSISFHFNGKHIFDEMSDQVSTTEIPDTLKSAIIKYRLLGPEYEEFDKSKFQVK